jgi:hypothetical protein
MLKLTVAVVAVALAGTAGAAGWKSLKVDGSSEEAFAQSLAVFKHKLSPLRRYVFGEALKDIWVQGSTEAEAEGREYSAADYYAQLHGLGFKEVVTLTDPSGATAKERFRTASWRLAPRIEPRAMPAMGPRPAGGWGSDTQSLAQGMQACRCGAPNGYQGN